MSANLKILIQRYLMNKLIKREFLQVKPEDTRKRWFATMQCQQCNKEFTIREKTNRTHLINPCESCSKKNIAYSKFIQKSKQKHGDKFDYSLVTKDNYVNLFTPVDIICKSHGVFKQKPKDHVSKTNGKLCCPSCIQEFNKIHNKRSIDSWKEELYNKHPHITFVSHGNADSNREKCTLTCSYHGEFTVALADIKNSKYLCSFCAQDHNSWGGRFRRIDIPGLLYHIFIPTLNMWKLGVTSTTVKERFRQFPYDYIIVWERSFITLNEAYLNEMQLFRKFKHSRNKTLYTELSGYTELLTCEIPITALHSSNAMSKEF